MNTWVRAGLWAALGAGCQTGAGPTADDTTVDPPDTRPAVIRRLSVAEYDASVYALVGLVTTAGADALPADPAAPFDNMVVNQQPSAAFTSGVEHAARAVSEALRARADLLAVILPCPAEAAWADPCVERSVLRLARRALRRDLRSTDASDLLTLGGAQAAAYGSSTEGLLAVVEALLQDPEFVFRVERGAPSADDPAVLELDAFAIASRMAFFLWGEAPDEQLLDAAATGALTDPAARAAEARRMIEDPRAEAQVHRFHEQWLGYQKLTTQPEFQALMRYEVNHLVSRVIFEDRSPWTELLLARYALLDAFGAGAYGLPYPAGAQGPVWVDFPEDSDRSGLLSQGAFANVAANVMDTSPTKRGKLIRERLMCQAVAPPPDPTVAANPPDVAAGGACKSELYAQHREDPACAGCHAGLDGIGFGLEHYNTVGMWRDYEYLPFSQTPNDDCPINAVGEIPGVGTFTGARGLAELLVGEELVQACVARTALTWGLGEQLPMNDPAVTALYDAFRAGGWQFTELLVAVVQSERFARAEVTP